MVFSRRKMIGVLINQISIVTDEALLATLRREARRLDFDMAIFFSPFDERGTVSGEENARKKSIRKFVPLESLDGMIVVSDAAETDGLRNSLREESLKRVSCPVVVIRGESEDDPCVFTDSAMAMRTLVRHLTEAHSLTDIRLWTGDPENPGTGELIEGFTREMAAHGLEVSDESILRCRMGDNSGDTAYHALFSDPGHYPQAVACGSDQMAVELIRELRDQGIRVPEDVIVTGFDHVSDWCADIPSLTTVQRDDRDMAVRAMDMLDRLIRGETPGEKKVRLPGTLIPGESCGCGQRHAGYYRELADRLRMLQKAENEQDAVMSRMSRDLGACTDLEELHRAMSRRKAQLSTVRDHYICLFGTSKKLMDEANSETCLVHAIRDHGDAGMPMITFNRESLLPPLAEREEEPQLFFIVPLNQEDHEFGYSVLQYDPDKLPSGRFLQTNALLSIALDNIRRQHELLALYEERRLSSVTDHMTGLLNRRGLMESVEPLWSAMTGREIAFICIDMDYLKHTNDTFGHAAGDAAIRLIGKAIQQSLPEGAMGSRSGGDEFIIFLPDAGNDQASELVRRFRRILDELTQAEKRSYTVSASAGFKVVRPDGSTTIDECLRASDQILYQMKENRPDKYVQSGWNRWKIQQMPVPFGTANTTLPYYAKPCNERLSALPEALMKLAEGGYTWEFAYVAGKPDYALTLMDYPNIYSFIHTHELDADEVRRVLSNADLMVHRKAFTPEEIDLLLGDDQAKAMEHFAAPSTIVIGEKGYSEKWMYDHASSAWKQEGITPGMVIQVLPYYYNPLFVKKAADMFSLKLYNYTGMVTPVKWKQWKAGDIRPDGSVEEEKAPGKSVMLDVAEYCQYSDYPTGCESVSLWMLLNYYGADVTADQIIELLPMGAQPYDVAEGIRYGGNPEREFVGDPRKEISYGVFNGPVAQVAEQILPGVKTKTGASLAEIRDILDTGNPVMAWYLSAPMRPVMYRWSWTDDRGETVYWPGGEHAVVICGYDESGFTYRDPNSGTTVEIDNATFEKGFSEMGGRIIYYLSDRQPAGSQKRTQS